MDIKVNTKNGVVNIDFFKIDEMFNNKEGVVVIYLLDGTYYESLDTLSEIKREVAKVFSKNKQVFAFTKKTENAFTVGVLSEVRDTLDGAYLCEGVGFYDEIFFLREIPKLIFILRSNID